MATPKLKTPRILYFFSLMKFTIEFSIINQYKLIIKILIKLYFYSKMIDFSRTFCDLHPNQLISNFCSRQQCNIGLCATCICSHTETHMQKHTAPEYQNIRTTYSKMQDNIRTRISELQHQKLRINNLVENIQNKRKGIANTISQAREEALGFVNRFFDAKEKEIMRKLQADEKKIGLHNQNRMDSLNNSISRDINSLFVAAQDLNSTSFLESFHRIRTQVLANSLQTQRQISDQLDKNQNYEALVSINPAYINQVKVALQKCLQFCWEEKKLGQKVLQIKESREGFNKSSRVMVSQNQILPANVVQKRPESTPKPNFLNQMSRCSSNIIQPYASSFFKQPIQQIQPMHTIYQHPVRYQTEPFISNNSAQAGGQPKPAPNYSPRIQMRVNSSQKNIKENGTNKHPLTQSYMDINFGMPANQLEASKKIRRSGLTVLRTLDNEAKS